MENITARIVDDHIRLIPNLGLVRSIMAAIAATAVSATGMARIGTTRSPFTSTIDAEKVSVVTPGSTAVRGARLGKSPLFTATAVTDRPV